jgi:hypothetical protein
MQYEPVAQSVAVVMPLNPEDYKRNPEIRKARSTLLGFLSGEIVRIISYQS